MVPRFSFLTTFQYLTLIGVTLLGLTGYAKPDRHHIAKDVCSQLLASTSPLLAPQSVDPKLIKNQRTDKKAKAPKYKTYSMLEKYEDEEKGRAQYFDMYDIPHDVTYLQTTEERLIYQIFVEGGHFYNFNGKAICPLARCEGILVMTPSGELYFTTLESAGFFHHSSFVAGGEVAFAGKAEFFNGKLEWVNTQSGHYEPDALSFQALFLELLSFGITNYEMEEYEGFLFGLAEEAIVELAIDHDIKDLDPGVQAFLKAKKFH